MDERCFLASGPQQLRDNGRYLDGQILSEDDLPDTHYCWYMRIGNPTLDSLMSVQDRQRRPTLTWLSYQGMLP
jgi:hypothetical protein